MQYQDIYKQENLQKTLEHFGVTNKFALPRITKVIVNVGAGETVVSKNVTVEIAKQLSIITGQKAVICKARKSISAFKVRAGLPIGVMVTLRGKKMYDFVNKTIAVVIPLLKDFRGLKDSVVDHAGNINIGLPEQTLFQEIDFDMIDKLRGLQVTMVTTAKDHATGLKFFRYLGVPFQK